MSKLEFPRDFLWGTATSAFQIEGAAGEDGRGESIWDRFCATPGKIADGSDARVACDHYHRWKDDLALLSELGVGAYRFSIAWPRVLPAGHGTPDPRGLDFYERLVDALLERGIRPFATLYHWDLPQALQDRGGWGSRDTAEAFVEYAEIVSMRLGDRVRHWVTHNEPWCISHLGHEVGEQAPGHRDPAESLAAAHHVLLSHGWTVPALRRNAPGAEVGIVLNLTPATPASPSAADAEATRAFDGFFNRWYLDPLFRGRYPEDAVADRVAQGHLPAGRPTFLQPGDLATIAAPVDFLGLNYYSRSIRRSARVPEAENAPRTVFEPADADRTDMGWEVWPRGLHDTLVRLHREYRVPKVYVTENGVAYPEGPDASGRVRDARRSAYLTSHLAACATALQEGVPLAGYFHWSLLDNFEWAHGYKMRFGLVHVDYATQRRTPKDSFQTYQGIIAANAVDAG
ncbi:MAG: GH1 family beta-glucosidase [Anaeromyxobacter sp.]